MQNQSSPLVLTFGGSDPTGMTGIQADLACFTAFGCFGVSTLTSLFIGDTTGVEDMQLIEPDWVSDQARALLEDMEVNAFKIGAIGSIENASVIAEIVSDYPDAPLVLDPFFTGSPDPESDDDDLILAIRELLVPQSALFVISAVELTRLAETWREPSAENMLGIDVMHLIRLGCEYVLVTGTPCASNEVANSLYGEEGLVRQSRQPRLPGSFGGAGATLAAAVAALLANGLDVPDAVEEAEAFTLASLTHAHRLGMGKLMPDRGAWHRDPAAADNSGSPSMPAPEKTQ